MVVVLPQPLLPSRPKVSPCRILKDKSLMTVLPPKEMLKCLTSIMFLVVLGIFKDILSLLLHLCFICGVVFGILNDMKKLLMIVCALCFATCFCGGDSYAAAGCRDVEFIYARGSGATRNNTFE